MVREDLNSTLPTARAVRPVDSGTSSPCVRLAPFRLIDNNKPYSLMASPVPSIPTFQLDTVNQGSAVSGAQQELGGQTDQHTQSILAQGFAQTQAFGSNAVQQGGAVDLNEDGIIDDYERAYSRGEAQKGQMSSESMGTAAAMSVSTISVTPTLHPSTMTDLRT